MSPPSPLEHEDQVLDLEMTLELPMADPRLSRVALSTSTDHTQVLPLPDFSGHAIEETAELRVLPASLAWDVPVETDAVASPADAPSAGSVYAPPAQPVPVPAPSQGFAGPTSGMIALLERKLRELAERLSSKDQRVAALEGELAQVRADLGGRLDLLQSQSEARRQEDARRLAAAADRESALREELAHSRRTAQEQREALEARIASHVHALVVAEQQQVLMARDLTQYRHAAERHFEKLRHNEGRIQLTRGIVDAQATQILRYEAEMAAQALQHQTEMEARDAERRELDSQVAAGSRAMAELARERTDLLDQVASLRAQLASREELLGVIEAQSKADAAALAGLQHTLETLGLAETTSTGMTPAQAGPAADNGPLIAAHPMLVWEDEGRMREHPLGPRTTLGRTDDNDIVLDATFASRHHAVILREGRHLRIEDLNSTNGLRVNGHRVMQQLLHDGDVVTIGKTVFRCVYRIAE